MTRPILGHPGEGVAVAVALVAVRYGLDAEALDHHLEAEHGFERHDKGYAEAAALAALCLVTGVCTVPRCTCPGPAQPRQHGIECRIVAATMDYAMANRDGDVFYPDDLEEAAYFAKHHGARVLDPDHWDTAEASDEARAVVA